MPHHLPHPAHTPAGVHLGRRRARPLVSWWLGRPADVIVEALAPDRPRDDPRR